MWLYYAIWGANGEANHDAKNHDFESGFLYDFHAAEQRDRGFEPHMSLKDFPPKGVDKTPADIAGIKLPFKTWTEFVRQAWKEQANILLQTKENWLKKHSL